MTVICTLSMKSGGKGGLSMASRILAPGLTPSAQRCAVFLSGIEKVARQETKLHQVRCSPTESNFARIRAGLRNPSQISHGVMNFETHVTFCGDQSAEREQGIGFFKSLSVALSARSPASVQQGAFR